MSELPLIPVRSVDGPEPTAVTYKVHHLTSYRYRKTVTRNHGRAHVEPRATPFQRVISHEVSVDPTPAQLSAHTDFYGNSSSYLLVDSPHEHLDVHSRATVHVTAPQYSGESLTRAWEQCTHPNWGPLLPAASLDFIGFSPRIRISDPVREIARAVFTPQRPIGEALSALTALIHDEFTYDTSATTVASTLEDALAARRGVCQDFAHVGVAVARSVGLAARYVSGYLRTATAPVQVQEPQLEREPSGGMIGSAASHAWLSVLVPGTGWVDIDPTNRTAADHRFVTTAWGRDYTDVPPLKGIIVGPPGSAGTLSVSVSVAPLLT